MVAKLFFVELSNRGGLARIVSFIGVGVLLLVVGYFAPLPPKRIEADLILQNRPRKPKECHLESQAEPAREGIYKSIKMPVSNYAHPGT